MLTETTVTKLQEMRLSVMAKAFKEQLTDPLIADAICDRSVHYAYRIVIDCKESMRKRLA